MFCSNCGGTASGNFCSGCGAKLAVAPAPAVNWRNEISYDVLIAVPWITDRIARQAELARPSVSGEAVLDIFDKLAHNPIPSRKIAGFIQPLYGRMGISTGKTQHRMFHHPIGVSIVAGLCALARHGHSILSVRQHDDGCEITAKLPSDVFALEGSLIVSFRRTDVGAMIEAATKIPGQWFDWGKSTRCLKRLFNEIETGLLDEQWLKSA